MKNKFISILTYILIFFNSNLLSTENNNILKVGLLAPLSGEYKELGNSLLYSLQLALDEVNDKDVYIIPRDSGFNNKEMLNKAIQDIRSQGIKIIIGPITHDEFNEVKKYNDLIFISPSGRKHNIPNMSAAPLNRSSREGEIIIGRVVAFWMMSKIWVLPTVNINLDKVTS